MSIKKRNYFCLKPDTFSIPDTLQIELKPDCKRARTFSSLFPIATATQYTASPSPVIVRSFPKVFLSVSSVRGTRSKLLKRIGNKVRSNQCGLNRHIFTCASDTDTPGETNSPVYVCEYRVIEYEISVYFGAVFKKSDVC